MNAMSLPSNQSFSAARILGVDEDQAARDRLLFVSALADTSGYEGFLKVIEAHVLAKPLKVGALRRAVRAMLLGERAP
jgi:hypothetical protein